jgi:hypothetical protein
MRPDAMLPTSTLHGIADAYGLGEPENAVFVARGAMGSVNRLRTIERGERRYWTVKRSFWKHYSEEAIADEVRFTEHCASAGVLAPRSIPRKDTGGYVMALDDQPDGGSQYRVLEWVEGVAGQKDDPHTISTIAEWMARIHRLAIDPAGKPIDPWFVSVTYDWDELAGRLSQRAPDVAVQLRTHRADMLELTDLVNSTRETGAVWCHTDIGVDNLVWGNGQPHLIDWENAGPLVPHQELGCWVRSLGSLGKPAYDSYRQAGGPAKIDDVTHLASSVAVGLNFLGVQAELLLDDNHVEQHEFARAQLAGVAHGLTNLHALDQWIRELRA